MGKTIDGKYVYSPDDCACELCLYFDDQDEMCSLAECCCLEEKREALLHFPPDGYERRKGGAPCRG
jgi:hypothetical protein